MRVHEGAVDEEWPVALIAIEEVDDGAHAVRVVSVSERPIRECAQIERVGRFKSSHDGGRLCGGASRPECRGPRTPLVVDVVLEVNSVEVVIAVGLLAPAPGDEVVSSRPHDLIPCVLHGLQDVRIICSHHVLHGAMALRVRVPSREKAAPRGRADGILAVRLGECRALPCQGVHMGSRDCLIAEAAYGVRTKLIGYEPDDVS